MNIMVKMETDRSNLTFRFSHFKFTLPASSFSASPSSKGSAMKVSLFFLLAVLNKQELKREIVVEIIMTNGTTWAYLREAFDGACFNASLAECNDGIYVHQDNYISYVNEGTSCRRR